MALRPRLATGLPLSLPEPGWVLAWCAARRGAVRLEGEHPAPGQRRPMTGSSSLRVAGQARTAPNRTASGRSRSSGRRRPLGSGAAVHQGTVDVEPARSAGCWPLPCKAAAGRIRSGHRAGGPPGVQGRGASRRAVLLVDVACGPAGLRESTLRDRGPFSPGTTVSRQRPKTWRSQGWLPASPEEAGVVPTSPDSDGGSGTKCSHA